ncbi:ribonuclease D [Gammaproteobacteria bacterium 45_16_T64]|nr:ribonuclease D [Gammaproteobacteria bacterium 45_16_T64]
MITDLEYTWVDSDSLLTQMVVVLEKESLLGIDTEFMRTDTYYPKVGLIQISSEKGIYLIDPLSVSSLEPLRELLYRDDLEAIILHSCSEDLEVFKTLWKDVPTKVFDTQIAAAFLNIDRQPSLQKLLSLLMDIDIPKDETRSNWLQRPLTVGQLKYAALDVAYLLPVYRLLVERLREQSRAEWVHEECGLLIDKYSASIDFDNIYKSIGNAWKLRPKQLAALREIAAWRDRTAIEKNRPKGHVLKDASLYEIAERLPKDIRSLGGCENMSPGQVKRFSDDLLPLVAKAVALKPEEWPAAIKKPFSRSHKALAKKLKDVVEERSAALDLPMERIASRKLLERYAKAKLENKALPKELQGWRQSALVNALDRVFDSVASDELTSS